MVTTVGSAFTTIVNALAADVMLSESLTVTEKLYVPATVGVPEIRPVAGASDKLVGNAPDDTVHVEYGLVPPVTANVCAYAAVNVPSDNEAVLTTGAGLTTMDNDLATVVTLFASVAVTVKLNVPVAVGVPEITPVVAASDKPPGNAPDAMVHDAYGLVPPVAAKVCE